MTDKDKDLAIIETSALLVTLIFLILSFYGSVYAQYYVMVQEQKIPEFPAFLISLASFYTMLERFSYLIGFLFTVAALAATLSVFRTGPAWMLRGLRNAEFVFFAFGLALLGCMFLLNAPKDPLSFVVYAALALALTFVCIAHAYLHRGKN